MNTKLRPWLIGSSWMISVPVMSAGIRSGVNWMRLKDRDSVRDRVLTSRVLASPGTPTSTQCPRAKMAVSSSSTTWFCPMTTRPICARRVS